MNTIIDSKTYEIIIKNSRFICVIFPISDVKDVNYYLDIVKEKYKNATHYCYAYILDDKKKLSDDGEPGGTAGNPMMQVLEKHNLNHVLAVTIRYFGGIKLGSGGLVRAYSKSVTEVLKLCELKELILGCYVKITFLYNHSKNVDYLLKDINIIKKDYNEQLTYYFNCSYNLLESLKKYSYIDIQGIEENIYL